MSLRRGYRALVVTTLPATLLVAALLPASPRAIEGLPGVAGAHQAAPFAGVVLEDPQERDWDLSALRGHAVLLVVADRSASGASVEWGRRIGAARPQSIALWAESRKVAVVSVADLRSVPKLARSSARWIIARMVGEQGGGGPPLLLDWDGVVAGRIEATEGVANVRLYAADGSLVLREEGDATPDKVARLAAAIDALGVGSSATTGGSGGSGVTEGVPTPGRPTPDDPTSTEPRPDESRTP